MVLGPRESPVPFCVIIKISLIRNSTLCNLNEIFVSSEGQSTAEELESLIKFIKLLLEGAKEENSATYNENKNVFDEIIEDCENYSIIELGCNEMFSIKIL